MYSLNGAAHPKNASEGVTLAAALPKGVLSRYKWVNIHINRAKKIVVRESVINAKA
jgi:hypothetical protein